MARADGVSPQRRRWPLIAAAAIVVIVGAVIAVRVAGGRSAARAGVAEALAAVSQAEPGVLAVDQAVRSEVTTASVETVRAALERLRPTIEALSAAERDIERLRPRLGERDARLADAVAGSIAARLEMLARAEPILKTDAAVAQALEPAMRAWELVGSAEKTADEAVASFNKHTKEGVRRSTELATRADGMLAEARSLLETVAAGVPEADMGPFIAYIDAKRALLVESRKIDATWLAGKVADANAMLGAYNAKEKQVAERAKRLPGTPASALAEAYKRAVEADVAAYFEARERARSADAKIRSLQGG